MMKFLKKGTRKDTEQVILMGIKLLLLTWNLTLKIKEMKRRKNMGRIREININDGKRTLLYEDFKIVRHAKIGDIVILSDGHKYRVIDNETRLAKRKGREY